MVCILISLSLVLCLEKYLILIHLTLGILMGSSYWFDTLTWDDPL